MESEEVMKHAVCPIHCLLCLKLPEQLDEYSSEAAYLGITPDEYVEDEEGTFNPDTNHFYCTDCYIKLGMPLGVAP